MDAARGARTFGLRPWLGLATLAGWGVLSSAACAPPTDAAPYPDEPLMEPGEAEPAEVSSTTSRATYFGRVVDLEPFLTGFPFGAWNPDIEAGRLFFLEQREAYRLKSVPIDGPIDLASAETVSEVDWSKRSLWSLELDAGDGTLWLLADEKNDERMNLWTLDVESGNPVGITDHDYVYGFGFDEPKSRLAYLPRTGKSAPYRACLSVIDLPSLEKREIICDEPSLEFRWSTPRFSPDGRYVYFNAQSDGNRNRVQIVRVGLDEERPSLEVLTDASVARTRAQLVEGWLGAETYFIANDDGFSNLYALNAESGRIRQITSFQEDVSAAQLAGSRIIASHGSPMGSTLFVLDPRGGAMLKERRFLGRVNVLDAHGDRAWVTHTAPDRPFEAFDVSASKPLSEAGHAIRLSSELEQKMVHCDVEAVQIPTFDVDSATGELRKLHAFYYRPKDPNPKSRQLGFITAFYGGSNGYARDEQVLCAAGFTVVSPAVRGTSGFGKAFAALNDRDLGGDEIVDLFFVARWLEQQSGLPSYRIGVYGASHGGFATMRALTFDPATNDRNIEYPFGFGMAHAGFSDIKSFYDATNIPDWVVLESGDPNDPDDLQRMRERSPRTQVARLRAPILLTHGAEDWRVPVEESRAFVAAAREAGRPITYVEFEGMGHSIEGVERRTKLFQARFDFLEAVARAAEAYEANMVDDGAESP